MQEYILFSPNPSRSKSSAKHYKKNPSGSKPVILSPPAPLYMHGIMRHVPQGQIKNNN